MADCFQWFIIYCQNLLTYYGDAENARNENTRQENAAPKIRDKNGKSDT